MKNLSFILALTGALLLAGCTTFAPDEFTLDPPPVDSGSADFTKYVALGNSLSAGYQSGALYQSTQQFGFVQQLADAMGTADFQVPWIADPGIYNETLRLGHLQVVFDEEGNAGLAPIPWGAEIGSGEDLLLNPAYVGPYNNLAVPGATAYDLLFATDKNTCLTAQLGEANAYFDMVLRNEGFDWTQLGGPAADLTAVEQAVLAEPTFMSVWIGNNELLIPATRGWDDALGPYRPLYPASDGEPAGFDFETIYTGILGTLTQSLPNTKFVTADLPYVTAIPYFTTVPWFVVDPDQNPVDDPTQDGFQFLGLLAADGTAGFFGLQLTANDLVCLSLLSYDSDHNGVPDLNEGLGIPDAILVGSILQQNPDWTQEQAEAALPVAFPHHGGLIPDALTLVASEITEVLQATDDYNDIIHTVAGGLGIPVVPINASFDDVAANGAIFNGESFSTTFVTGGLFSLDGVHPANVLYALIAGKFIETINGEYGSDLQEPTLPEVPRPAAPVRGLPELPEAFPGMPY